MKEIEVQIKLGTANVWGWYHDPINGERTFFGIMLTTFSTREEVLAELLEIFPYELFLRLAKAMSTTYFNDLVNNSDLYFWTIDKNFTPIITSSGKSKIYRIHQTNHKKN